ncbi:helix-turn-helix domain-containing protein [Desulfovirgula thermocuniculi]|uniref:helix-turn-helix domain-containing protein n=1 Tax=Desulfovirgula thermocuniculi TaxID=348842 RepID=UPI000488DE0A|nr:helix-turn-helix domain-containing protein [Desulfovirgula thermocuniculi]
MGPDVLSSLKREFTYALIFGNLTSIKEIMERKKALSIGPLPNHALLVQIDNLAAVTAGKSHFFKQGLKQKLWEAVEAACRHLPAGLAAPVGDEGVAVLLPLEHAGDEEALVARAVEQGSSLREEVCAHFSLPAPVSVGIGRAYRDVRQINLSYQEAREALRYRPPNQQGVVVHIANVTPRYWPTDLTPEIHSRLLERIRLGDGEGAARLLGEMMPDDAPNTGPHSPYNLKAWTVELMLAMWRAASENGLDTGAMASGLKYLQQISAATSAAEMRRVIMSAARELAAQAAARLTGMRSQVVKRALEYINRHYAHPISLHDVASSVGLSSCYFSYLFKKEVGQKFIDYLSHLRIEKAKQLLLTTTMSVAEIAHRVGYHDPNYFSKVFKNLTGVPPKQFKNQILERS